MLSFVGGQGVNEKCAGLAGGWGVATHGHVHGPVSTVSHIVLSTVG